MGCERPKAQRLVYPGVYLGVRRCPWGWVSEDLSVGRLRVLRQRTASCVIWRLFWNPVISSVFIAFIPFSSLPCG